MKNRRKLDFRKMLTKLILIVLTINLFFIICIPNTTLAKTEAWKDFYYRFKDAADTNNASNLSDNDIRRMLEGPQGFDGIWDLKTTNKENLAPLQEFAKKIQSARQHNGTWSESWDEFYERFSDEITNGNEENLSDEDIWRASQGPTDQERGFPWATASTDLEKSNLISENSKRIKEDRLKNGTWDLDYEGNRIGESDDKSQTTGLTNDERREEAKKLWNEINSSYQSHYDDKETLEAYRDTMNKISSYYDEDMQFNTVYNDIDARIVELGGEHDNSYYDNQVGSNGLTKEEEEEKEADKMKGTLGNYIPNTPHTIDEIINEADSFINTGKKEQKSIPISSDSVTLGSGLIYNILLAIAVVVAVIVGLYLAIKFMMSSAEDKAKVKEMLIPYIVGCIVIFSAFTIWKLVVTILGNIA